MQRSSLNAIRIYTLSLALAGTCISADAQSINTNMLTQYSPQNLAPQYLNAPVQRYYSAGPDASTFLTAEDFPCTNLQGPLYSQIYYSIPLLRRTMASDDAVAAFWDAPGFGTSFQQAVSSAILYSPLPHGPMTGISPVNSVPNIFSQRRASKRIARITAKLNAANLKTASTTPASPQGGLVGQIKNLANAKKGNKLSNKASFQTARTGLPQDFTMIVSRDPSTSQTYLYVVGKLPKYVNPDSPTNYILFADQYKGTVDQAGNELPVNQTVLDKQNLPAATDQEKYYCFVYSLTSLQPNVENNLIASYWSGKDLAVRQDVALAAETGNKTAAIPMLRVIRYLRYNLSYAVLVQTPIGGSTTDAYREVLRSRFKTRVKK